MDSEDSTDDEDILLGSDRITRSSSSDIVKPRPPVPSAEQPATFFKVAAVMAAGLPSPVTGWFWITDSRGVC
jgi:hypothetical protein